MLKKLQIQNYAIIDEVLLDLGNGLTIITGETGAGKSILLGALGLIMGKRTDTKVLYTPEQKCVVEGIFSEAPREVLDILQEEELDTAEELYLRREISPNGKSRAFINDTPVNLDVLQKVSQYLLDLHQQGDNLEIHQEDYQMDILDAFIQHEDDLHAYKKDYEAWKKETKHLSFLENLQQNAARETEFNRYLLEELEVLQPVEGEQPSLEKELDLLSNSRAIQEIFARVLHVISESEPSVQLMTTQLLQDISGIKELSPDYRDIYDRLFSIREELKDIARESGKLSDQTEYNPERIEEIKERLNSLYKIQKKHGVQDEASLLSIWENLRIKMEEVDNVDLRINESNRIINQLEKNMSITAAKMSASRSKAIPVFELKVKELLGQLKMDHARLVIDVKPSESFTSRGKETARWLFAANKGSTPLPLKSVASGGEISRLNLCIKSLVARSLTLPTLIFDEIDAGVSGDVALKMGSLLATLSGNHQIISITHSPQVASRATKHFFVFKDHEGHKTNTRIKVLSPEERIQEIAIMLSSDPPSPAAVEAAKDLLGNQ